MFRDDYAADGMSANCGIVGPEYHHTTATPQPESFKTGAEYRWARKPRASSAPSWTTTFLDKDFFMVALFDLLLSWDRGVFGMKVICGSKERLTYIGEGWMLKRLRDTCAVAWVRSGMPLEYLRQLLGLSRIEDTLPYARLVRGSLDDTMAELGTIFCDLVLPVANGTNLGNNQARLSYGSGSLNCPGNGTEMAVGGTAKIMLFSNSELVNTHNP